MHPKAINLLSVLAALVPFELAAEEPPVVAVFDIQSKVSRIKRASLSDLTDQLRVRLAQTKRMIIIDKSEQERELKRLINEQRKASYKRCIDESCQIPLGKELAASKILKTKLMRFGKIYVLSSEIIDLKTGGSDGAAAVETRGTSDALLDAINVIAGKLTGTGKLEGGAGQTVRLGTVDGARVRTVGGTAGAQDGIVKFTSKPAGLSVWVGSRKLSGTTPLEDFLPLGKRKIRMSGHPSYKNYQGRVRLNAGMNVAIALEPITSEVVIVVRDDTGKLLKDTPIKLDGVAVAKAPVRLADVLIGPHEIEIESPHGAPEIQKIDVRRGKTTRLELKIASPATLQKREAKRQARAKQAAAAKRAAEKKRQQRKRCAKLPQQYRENRRGLEKLLSKAESPSVCDYERRSLDDCKRNCRQSRSLDCGRCDRVQRNTLRRCQERASKDRQDYRRMMTEREAKHRQEMARCRRL